MLEKFRDKKIKQEIDESDNTAAKSKDVALVINRIIPAISCIFCIFQIYTAFTKPFQAMQQRSVHLGFALALVFLYAAEKEKHLILRIVDYALAILGVVGNIYILFNWQSIMVRSSKLTVVDIVMAVILIILVIEAARRNIGFWMPLIAVVFIAYSYFGQHLDGILHISKLSLNRFLTYVSLGTEGIYGTCLGTSATFAFMFILFAEFLIQLGAGDFIINLAESLMGHVRGGPAKIAIMASGLFGTVSGSAVANVASTGCMTIPMMKKKGFKPEFAAGVEATASTGGQIMPPVMGTSAFLMAELTNIAYSAICIAAIIPAILYFTCLFVVVDLEAAKNGLEGIPRENMPRFKKVMKEGWHYLFSIGVLVLLLVILQWSASKSALYATIALIIVVIVKKLITHQKIEWQKVFSIFTKASKSILAIATATSCAGIVVGAFTATGLNLRFSSMLVDLAGGKLILLLILAMFGAFILGMGLPPTSVYILMAILVAPALTSFGIPVLVAHMYIFYFGVMAPITPPVGLAFYVGAGIADCPAMKAGVQAVKLAITGFIIPYIFVYNPALLLQGTTLAIIQVTVTTLIGILSLAFVFEGYSFRKLKVFERALYGICAACLVIPETFTDVAGLILFAILVGIQFIQTREVRKSKGKIGSAA